MAPSLTNGCINKILNGEEVPNPVIQILNYKKPCTDRYSLLISDGVTGYPFVTMDTDLNKMLERREIQKFIVVRVDDYFCQSVSNDHTIIILCELTVLASGKEINKRLGNPVIVTRNSSTTIPLKTEANEAVYTSPKPLFQPSKNFTTEPEAGTISDTDVNKFLNLESCTMAPSLTSGSINKILNSEDVSNPVIQILGCKKCPGTEQKNERYRLLISDGVTGYSFATLGTQLNHMVANKELEKFTVVRVDKYVCNQVQTDRKVIFLLNLTVLAPADEVNEKLGNPINSTTVSSTATPSENGANGTIPTAAKPLFQPERYPAQESSGFGDGEPTTHPINSLTPYQNRWTIKARVTSKTPLRTYSSSRGEGKVFSVNLLDESGEIKATGFNETADRFYEMFEINKVYYISKGNLKPANAKYNTVKHEYELTFNNDTLIMPCDESASSIPMMQYDFVPIDQLEQVDKDANVDVIGVVKSVGDVQTFVARTTNKELTKRDVKLVDRSNREVSLTLWGKEAENFGDGSSNPVVAIKGARVSDFNGRSLSVSMSSTMSVNPDIKEAHVLKGWYEREGCNMEAQSISNTKTGGGSMGGEWKTFAQAVSENLGMGDKPDYYINKATVVMVRKENCMYMACPTPECNKKVVDMNNGLYRCEKCDREQPEFKWRLLLSLSIADFTENQWVTCFQESGESILKVSAQDLGTYKESEEEKFNEIMADANFESYIFKLRTKRETYNEESRMKTTVVTVNKVDPVVYTKKLLNDIKQLQQEI